MSEKIEKRYEKIKKANKRLKEENKKLLEVDNLKSKFLANMSHELKAPLNAIIGFSDILLRGMDGDLSGKQVEDIKFIKESGKKLSEHINELLDFSKIEANMVRLNKDVIDINNLIVDTIQITRATIGDKLVVIDHKIEDHLPPIIADRVMFRQIVLNLLSNAVKCTEKGKILLEVRKTKEKKYIEASVTDTGIGIKKKDCSTIFEPFRQVDSSRANKQEGIGLGLAISKSFVEMHGGKMWFKSKIGKGTTFYFTLPVATI